MSGLAIIGVIAIAVIVLLILLLILITLPDIAKYLHLVGMSSGRSGRH